MKWHDNGICGLTYDDVLIRPAYSQLSSRQDCDYSTKIILPKSILNTSNNINGLAPIMIANMRSLATEEMCNSLSRYGIIVPSHRFQPASYQKHYHDSTSEHSWLAAASIGLNDQERLHAIANLVKILFLELAHCDSSHAIQKIKWLKKAYPELFLVAGNVATAEATRRLFDAGADMVKVGIGPGAVCTTRIVTGCGVPQLSAILECSKVGPIIADGGIKCSGDIVKALAAGAKFVMIGSLFAGTDEAAGDRIRGAGGKIYYGMASREAGKVTKENVPEGIATTVPYAGPAPKIAEELLAGLRQGMAMVGARTLDELREKAVFQRVSPATIIENQPHINIRS